MVASLALAGCSDDAPSASSQSSTTVTVTSSAAAPDPGSSSGDGSTNDRKPLQPVATDDPATTAPQQPTTRPASDFVENSYLSFASPTGKIQCRALDRTVNCQTEGAPHTVAESALCGFYPGEEQGRAVSFGWFAQSSNPCATIIQGDGYRSSHTLAYGESVTLPKVGPWTITCTSASTGITCTQSGGPGARGFFLSGQEFSLL
jgi:hypothetical protein